MKTTKKSALMSVMALFLCLTMLLGTTWAWFTDSVTSSGNKIQAGNLKLDLEMLNKETGAYESIKTSKDPIFNYNLWEPGYTDVKFLKVENEGSLSLKWKAMFVSDAEVSKLVEVIDVWVKPSVDELAYSANRESISAENGWRNVGTLDNFINTLSETTYGNLLPYSCAYLGIALHMQESAGNDYQKIGLEAFDIQIVATQMSQEEDSFGKDYDNDAEWPNGEMKFKVPFSFDDVATIYGELAEDKIVVDPESGAYAIIPAGAKIVEGVEPYFSGNGIGNSGTFSDEIRSYDIHIEGIAPDNTKPITVFIGKILPAGLGETELKLYHEDVQMTRVNSVEDFAINNQFTYDAETGAVVLYVTNFSVFSGVKTTASKLTEDTVADTSWYVGHENDSEYTLTSAAQFLGFRDLVDGKVEGIAPVTFAGKTVKLGVDIDLAGHNFDPIGFGYWYEKNVVDDVDKNTVFMGTFDGQKHTIYGLYQNGWDLGYSYGTQGGGLFASIKNATIKNLTISGAEIVFECVDMGIVVGYAQGTCHFENIVVTKSKIANYNRYTGGVVGEVSYGPYGIDTSLGYSHTFKNVVVDSSVTVSGLWGSFGCGMGGVIGGKWGDATVLMENVISAPTMDVYNDVVSAYQWYAFRGCGMLIGHTEEPYSDGRHSGNATASFLTCENVNVYYGGWVDQNYYRFSTQTDKDNNPLWYSNYPWVRAEAGEYCDAFSNIRYGIPQIGGVKVTEIAGKTAEELADEHVVITFDQLYGADRGMYGTATHEGVTINNKDSKTIYFQNTKGWENLKLTYVYKTPFDDNTWTTVVEGISLGDPVDTKGIYDIYKVTVPSGAYAFTIIGDGENETTKEIELEGLEAGDLYAIGSDGEIKHCDYVDGYKTVYFENNKGWENVYIYYWCNDGKADWGTIDFPGVPMNFVTESQGAVYGVYSFDIPAYADGFIFSDGKDNITGTEHYQSVDVQLTSDPHGKIFYLGSIDNNQVVDGNKVNYKYSVKSTKYVTGYKTITFANNWLWNTVYLNYNGNSASIASNGTDIYKTYKITVPNYATSFTVGGPSEASASITTSTVVNGSTYAMFYTGSKQLMEAKKLYLKPGTWSSDNARFSAYVWSGNTKIWVDMKKIDNTYYGTYIPKSYNNIIFGRMNPSTTANNFNSGTLWNQTGDLTYNSTNTCFQINGYSYGQWIKK